MKVGAIGAGGWGKNIVRTLAELDSLHAVADLSPAILEGVKSSYPGVELFDSPGGLLSSDVDAVCIATPAATHFAVAKEALLAGKDVFLEKPMTTSAEEAEKLVEIAKECGRVLMVDHLLLFQPAIRWMKEAIVGGLIGQVYSIHAERLGLGRVRSYENVFWSLGVHDVAVLLYLVDQAEIADTATSAQAVLQPNIVDDFHLHVAFRNGLKGHLHTSWLWPLKERRTVIVGSEGMLVFDEQKQNVVLHRKRIAANLSNIDEGEEVVFEGSAPPLTAALQHFMHCVETRETPLTSGETAVPVISLMEKVGA